MNNKRAWVLALSVGLGVVAAVLNWVYLVEKGRGVESQSFVGIAEGTRVQRGDVFSESQLVPVSIPKNRVGSLAHFAIDYDDRQTVVGMPATRNYEEGELVLRTDMKSPPQELELQSEDERAMWIPVDTRTFVPTLVTPGDYVSFLVSTNPGSAPAVVEDDDPENENNPPRPISMGSGPVETIGPFRVMSLGNRLGSSEVMRSAGIPQVQENVMTISVRQINGQLEPKAQKLFTLLRDSNFRQAGVLWHSRKARQP